MYMYYNMYKSRTPNLINTIFFSVAHRRLDTPEIDVCQRVQTIPQLQEMDLLMKSDNY